MSYEVKWAVENAVIVGVLWGDSTIDEVSALFKETYDLVESSLLARVQVIIDARQLALKQIPAVNKFVPSARKWKVHARAGWSALVRHSNPILNFLSDVMMQATGLRVRTVKTLTEAVTFLQSVDDQIDWSQLPADFYKHDTQQTVP
ncbi:MAG: hypothetical protein SGJ24_00320 [Chloroflexota bacterium]|nr:hypothetical protein [Chloroflexota bacterium]